MHSRLIGYIINEPPDILQCDLERHSIIAGNDGPDLAGHWQFDAVIRKGKSDLADHAGNWTQRGRDPAGFDIAESASRMLLAREFILCNISINSLVARNPFSG